MQGPNDMDLLLAVPRVTPSHDATHEHGISPWRTLIAVFPVP